jgi:hypothetical protein
VGERSQLVPWFPDTTFQLVFSESAQERDTPIADKAKLSGPVLHGLLHRFLPDEYRSI